VTEGRRKVLFVATVESHLLNFHIPFMKLLQEKGYEVHVATRLGNRQQEFDEIGIIKHNVDFSRSPYSPKVFKSLQQMEKLLEEIRFRLFMCIRRLQLSSPVLPVSELIRIRYFTPPMDSTSTKAHH